MRCASNCPRFWGFHYKQTTWETCYNIALSEGNAMYYSTKYVVLLFAWDFDALIINKRHDKFAKILPCLFVSLISFITSTLTNQIKLSLITWFRHSCFVVNFTCFTSDLGIKQMIIKGLLNHWELSKWLLRDMRSSTVFQWHTLLNL